MTEPIRWPPPGLERMQGDLAVLATRAGMTGLFLVLPLLAIVGLEQDRAAFGPFADAWWVLLVLGVVGLAFALDTLGRLARILRRSRSAMDKGYTTATVLRVLADRGRDMGFLISGARHFTAVEPRERDGLAAMRVAAWVLLCCAGLWLLVAMALGLFLAARGGVGAWALQVAAFFPAGVLYAAGAVAMLVQDERVRRARRVWFKQPWASDLATAEVQAWQDEAGMARSAEGPRGLRLALAATGALALSIVLPVLTLLPASAVGPILTEVSMPSFERYGQRAMRAEAFRSYTVEGDPSISAEDAGTLLHRLVYVGESDPAPTGEQEPDERIAMPWLPVVPGDVNPMGVEPFMWGDSLMPRVAQGLSADQRAYLEVVASHPGHDAFSRLASATALDAGSARWSLPFAPGVTLATLPFPRFGSFRDGVRAQIGAAALAWAEGRDDDAERMLRNVVSVGFLLADDGPTLIDNLIGFTLVDAGGAALADLYRLSGRTREAAELSRVRQVADRNAETARSTIPSSSDAWVRSLYAMTTDTSIARGLRWEYFINLATIAPCLNLNRIVFGVGEDYDAFIMEARSSLVRWPSDEALFELARFGWTGATTAADPTLLSRLAGLYMDSGPSSCGQFVQHMQNSEAF